MVRNGIFAGKKVEVTSGSLTGVIGTIENINHKNRLAISIEILNRTVIVLLNDETSLKEI